MSIPSELKYTKEHEWLKLLENDEALIGITDFAQQSLGDITFVELPEAGDTFDVGESFGVVESVKAASDLYMPIKAEILESNAALEDAPESVNRSPYEKGWLVKARLLDPGQAEALLDAEAYEKETRE